MHCNRYTRATDVWSYGVTCVELLSRRTPYPHVSPADFAIRFREYRSVCRCSVRLSLTLHCFSAALAAQLMQSIPDTTPSSLVDVTRRCVSDVVAERPTFEQLVDDLRRILKRLRSGETSDSTSLSAHEQAAAQAGAAGYGEIANGASSSTSSSGALCLLS